MKSAKTPAQKKKSDSGDIVSDCIKDIRAGKMIVVVDDENRENEGDLVMAASKATARNINFMATYGRGLICVPLADEVAGRLGLDGMVAENRESFRTAFTVSVDAAKGIGTGISAQDRSRTIRLLADSNSQGNDFVRPGHVFPLMAKPGGVLQRAGHTEAAVDLARLAGLQPVGVICEILARDGTMARLPQLKRFASRHGLKICTVEQLIEYRSRKEELVRALREEDITTSYGNARLHEFVSTLDGRTHFALVFGNLHKESIVRVRVHREYAAQDLFSSGSGANLLHQGLQEISRPPGGVFVYMRTETMRAELTRSVGRVKEGEQQAALREYGLGAQILRKLGLQKICLITRRPIRAVGLEAHGLEIVKQQPLAPPKKSKKR